MGKLEFLIINLVELFNKIHSYGLIEKRGEYIGKIG
jgi:hypothetical protein|tara:strand:+ start:907 stop:1014 length:108 start_codon:yes stop_codon:yes gene_type:complete